MAFQIHMAGALATSTIHTTHHIKQLAALIPLLCADVAFIILLGPSTMAEPSCSTLMGAFLMSVLTHAGRAWSATQRYTVAASPSTLVGMIQSICTLLLHLGAIALTQCRTTRAWSSLRAMHFLIGTISIALCVVLRLGTGSADAEFPPLRGSFEGAIVSYLGFIANSVYLTPSRRRPLHRALTTMLQERWLPLSALKRDELQQLLEGLEDPNLAPQPATSISRGLLPRESRAIAPRMGYCCHGRVAWALAMEESAPLCVDELEPCGASTLGSSSEVGGLASLAALAAPPMDPPPSQYQLRVPPLPYSPAYYERQRVLERTLADCGFEFSEDSSHSDGLDGAPTATSLHPGRRVSQDYI